MFIFPKHYSIQPHFDNQAFILKKAEEALTAPIPHITDSVALKSEGSIHDYYSNGDYWWPNPDTLNGLPYIRRDGETNPDNFNEHRKAMCNMSYQLSYLACAYQLQREERFAKHAIQILKEFFLDEKTKMNPNLSYAQAILGICAGRGIGIIDTLHITDVPFAIKVLCHSPSMTLEIQDALKQWFAQYLEWMLSDTKGLEEMNTQNNHSVCFFMQASVFALFTENKKVITICRERYKHVLLNQMKPDGSFPLELARTKPYNYSIFIVDNMVSICHLLSTPEDDLWEYTSPSGQGIKKAIEFLTPYLLDKSTWPYSPDIMHYDAFPIRSSFLLFAGFHYGMISLIDLFEQLPYESDDDEARRNLAIIQPILWI